MITTTANTTVFHPYKVLSQERSRLQLKASSAQTISIVVLRFMPLLILCIAVVIYLSQKDNTILFALGGMALLEAIIFSFIKIPASVSMDNIGFTLERLSTTGTKEVYYLWSDVDYIRHRVIKAKNSTSLSYQAVLKTGKKVSFLTFPSYHQKLKSIPDINAALQDISNKEIREK